MTTLNSGRWTILNGTLAICRKDLASSYILSCPLVDKIWVQYSASSVFYTYQFGISSLELLYLSATDYHSNPSYDHCLLVHQERSSKLEAVVLPNRQNTTGYGRVLSKLADLTRNFQNMHFPNPWSFIATYHPVHCKLLDNNRVSIM